MGLKFKKRPLGVKERLREFAKGLLILGEGLIGRCYVVDVETGEREKLSFGEAIGLASACFETAICGYIYEIEIDQD